MSETPDEDFKLRLAEALAWPKPVPCENESDYQACYARRGTLSSLSYTSKPMADAHRAAVDALLRLHEEALLVYNRRFLLKDGTPKLLAKYMAWTKRFTAISGKTAYLEARDHGVLRKRERSDGTFHFFVIGLNYEVNDNVFTTDRRGRDRRRRCKTLGRQAIHVTKDLPFEGDALAKFAATVPALADGFHETYVGSGKGSIPAIVMPTSDQQTLFRYLGDSPYEHGREIQRMDPWMGYAPPRRAPVNAELFA